MINAFADSSVTENKNPSNSFVSIQRNPQSHMCIIIRSQQRRNAKPNNGLKPSGK
jgi:hypothetical protein